MSDFKAIVFKDTDDDRVELRIDIEADGSLMLSTYDCSNPKPDKWLVVVPSKAFLQAITLLCDESGLTRAGADAPCAPESNQDSPADVPLDSARGSA